MTRRYMRAVRSGRARVEIGSITKYTSCGVVLTSGKEIDADVVVLATGFVANYDFLDEELTELLAKEDDGVWLYKNMLHPDIPGMAWVLATTMSFTSPLTAAMQAAWVADALCGHISVPSDAQLRSALEDTKRKRRAQMPNVPLRSGTIMGSFYAYNDDLLRDRGINPKRFGGLLGPLANSVVPVDPQQFTECWLPAAQMPRRRRRAPRALRVMVAALVAAVAGRRVWRRRKQTNQ
jgi:dimethylaniline monooxygenase (N-oxide forming)